MGLYINTGNSGFRTIRNDLYIDKSGLISYINSTIDTPRKLTCFSRPRRFGKSFAAKMLCAYYDRSCNSEALFSDLNIAKDADYLTHLNRYPVIYLDITGFISRSHTITGNIVKELQLEMIKDLQAAFPNTFDEKSEYLPDVLLSISQREKIKFIVIIDEWDALFREAKQDDSLQREYIQLLRGLFKNGQTTDQCIAAAYMTGILPIKKYGTQSALTDFREFTMIKPARLAEYIGFTEDEVRQLCERYDMDFQTMQKWYDGYSFHRISHVYSPNSVAQALFDGEYQNYWTSSETYESLKHYISENLNGLRDAVVMMLGGERVRIDTMTFQNDMTSLNSKDDVLTLLVHLGYLSFHANDSTVGIPNLEVADAFRTAVNGNRWEIIQKALNESDQLLKSTIQMDQTAVEDALDQIHTDTTSILQYNDENSLSCALTIAYYTAKKDYEIIRELPSGKGFADLAFIPYDRYKNPAMIIELKYNQSADTAIQQIKSRRYAGALTSYQDNLILVGINYDKNDSNKKHHCIIEKWR